MSDARERSPHEQALVPFFKPMPEDCPFRAFLDDEPIVLDGHILTVVSKWGAHKFGLGPEGFPRWLYKESGTGAAVVVPWSRTPSGKILVGMIRENRPNMGGSVWCAIGGINDPGESQAETQAREAREEAGIDTHGAKQLPGMRSIDERLHFTANVLGDEGISFSSIEIQFDAIEQTTDGLKLKKGYVKGKPEAEVVFFPFRDAALSTADPAMATLLLRLALELEMV